MTRVQSLAAGFMLLALSLAAPEPLQAGGLTFKQSIEDNDRLNNAESVAVSSTFVYLAASTSKAVSSWKRETDGTLTFKDIKGDRPEFGSVDGLEGAAGVLVVTSTGGTDHIYVAGATDDAVTVFSSDSNGALTLLQTLKDQMGGVEGLHHPTDITADEDGENVYVTSFGSNAIAVFTRDDTTGLLTFIEAPGNDPSPITGLNRPRGGAVSPDGKFFYTTGRVDPGDNSAATVVTLQRNDAGNGELSFVESLANLDGNPLIQRLQGTEQLVVSLDGKHVYVACRGSDSVLVFARNVSDGKLTFVEFQHAGGPVKGIKGAYGIATDADGHIYVAGSNDDALAVFVRDTSTGRLGFLQSFFNPKKEPADPTLVHGLGTPVGVAVAPGGGFVYVAGRRRSTVVTFENDTCGDNHTGIDEECDDDGNTNGDGCSSTCRLELCGTAPDPGPCRTPTVTDQATLKISNDPLKPDSKDQVQWQWKTGPATTLTEYGDPVNTDDYVLCVYDATGALRMSNAAPRGGLCKKGAPCWKNPNATKFSYSDSLYTPSGLQSVQVKADAVNGKPQIKIKGKGVFLHPPSLPIPALELPLKVQLRSTVTNGCWEATHHTLISNEPNKFQMKGN